MSSRSGKSTTSTGHGKSREPAEEWQLQILWELHKKQPRPTVEQRRLLATQTGLDAKWIARWFKRVNSTPKSKLQSVVGCASALSGSQTAVPATPTATRNTDDGFDSGKSVANLAEPHASPSLSSSGTVEQHALLFSSRSVVGPPATGSHHTRLKPWELELPIAVAPDLQENRECLIFNPHSQGPRPALPRSHLDLTEHTRRTLGNASTPSCLASTPSFQHGDVPSLSSTSTDVQSVKSGGPHNTSPTGTGPLQSHHFQLNLVSESPVLAPTYTALGHARHDLDPAAAAATAVARKHTNGVDLPVVPGLIVPQLGPSSSPLPSMYCFLFDMDCDSVDGLRCGDVSSRPSSKLLLGIAGTDLTDVNMITPSQVTPTPVSFSAKLEDMLALERQIRSSHCANSAANLSQQPKQAPEALAQAVAAETNREKRGSREKLPQACCLTGMG